jgi:hypothetical protein
MTENTYACGEPVGKRPGAMTAWHDARPVYSWWGAVLPDPRRLAVVDPQLSQRDTNKTLAGLITELAEAIEKAEESALV